MITGVDGWQAEKTSTLKKMQTNRYTCHLTVRGNELDSFGHVNNAIYLNYLEQARWEILRDECNG